MRLFFILIAILLLISCVPQEEIEPKTEECNKDEDCAKGGCSGQICTTKEKAKDIITTCEWREIYSCYKLTSCGCINNKCDWKSNPDFDNCMKKYEI